MTPLLFLTILLSLICIGLVVLVIKKNQKVKAIETINRVQVEKFYEILNNSADYIFFIDEDGKVLYQNVEADLIFGKKILGENLWQSLDLNPKDIFSIKNNTKDISCLTVDNVEKNFNIYKDAVVFAGRPIVVVYFRDITERTKIENELRNSTIKLEERIKSRTEALSQEVAQRKIIEDRLVARAKDLYRSNADLESFAYIASHDLKEPLRTVTSYVQLLERKYREQLDDQAKELIDFAVDGTKRMQSLINDLLEYSRIGTHARKFESVNLNDTLFLIMNSLTTQIEENDVALEVAQLPTITADKAQMKQVFQNFLANAIKFKHADRSPKIEVLYKDLGEHWRFGIKDNGIGIHEDYKDKIFMLFQRLNRRDQYNGTGVGLAICKRIIERHGGEVWLESKENVGSTFFFTIRKSIKHLEEKED